jgi:type IV pilus assembly protein PilA
VAVASNGVGFERTRLARPHVRHYFNRIVFLLRTLPAVGRNCSPSSSAMKLALRSRGAFTLVEIMIVVVIIGLLAMLALPAWQKVRMAAQDKAVLNNARQLSGAADQYYLETGSNMAALTALVGSTNYIRVLNTVAAEIYPDNYTQGVTITVSSVAGTRTITYAP